MTIKVPNTFTTDKEFPGAKISFETADVMDILINNDVPYLDLENQAFNNSTGTGVRFRTRSNGLAGILAKTVTNGQNELRIYTDKGNSPEIAIRITKDQDISLGAHTPIARLDVREPDVSGTAIYIEYDGGGNSTGGMSIVATSTTTESDHIQTGSGGGLLHLNVPNRAATNAYDFIVARNSTGNMFYVRGTGQVYIGNSLQVNGNLTFSGSGYLNRWEKKNQAADYTTNGSAYTFSGLTVGTTYRLTVSVWADGVVSGGCNIYGTVGGQNFLCGLTSSNTATRSQKIMGNSILFVADATSITLNRAVTAGNQLFNDTNYAYAILEELNGHQATGAF